MNQRNLFLATGDCLDCTGLDEKLALTDATDAHDGCLYMAVKTFTSCLERMALVPRVLDVTPAITTRLRRVGDATTAEILEVILREVSHVAAGSRWSAWCCALEQLDPEHTFSPLVAKHARGVIKGPFNEPARRAAGFGACELRSLHTTSAA